MMLLLGRLFSVLLLGFIVFVIVGTVFFGMEIGSKCNEYICIREY